MSTEYQRPDYGGMGYETPGIGERTQPRAIPGDVNYGENVAASIGRAMGLQRQSHDAVVNARIAAFDRAVATIRNSARPELQEKDILRLAVELVK